MKALDELPGGGKHCWYREVDKMLDLARYSDKPEYAELVEEIKTLRAVGSSLAGVCEIVATESEPMNPDCVKCEHVARGQAKTALAAWRNL